MNYKIDLQVFSGRIETLDRSTLPLVKIHEQLVIASVAMQSQAFPGYQ